MAVVQSHFLSTDDVPQPDRVGYWRDMICDVFVKLACDSPQTRNFYGRLINRSAGPLQFTEVISTSQVVERTRPLIGRAMEDYFLVSLQTRGVGKISQDGRTAILHPGDMALYDTTRPYRLAFDRDMGEIVLRLPRAMLSERLVAPERLTARTIRGNSGLGRIASAHVSEVFDGIGAIDARLQDRVSATVVDLIASAASEQLLGTETGTSSSALATLQRLLYFIEDHLTDHDLSRAMVATANGISPRYLNQLFEMHECGFREWVLRRRLECAKSDLGNPALAARTVSDIAYRLGFNDLSYFSRAFKAHFGESPRASRCSA
jgi:AraC-like DNA-binding protein